MKILIATDKFKGSLTAIEVAQAIASGINKKFPSAICHLQPLADGGEGTVSIIHQAIGGTMVSAVVKDPLFREITASYLLQDAIAYIEMAEASGLTLLNPDERDVLKTTSFGTGQLILHALRNGAKEIYLCIGGSATCDGGIGMAEALGYQFADQHGTRLSPVGASLPAIHYILPPADLTFLTSTRFYVISDVDNPLFGSRGAAFVFGPQKGADDNAVQLLDRGLRNLSARISHFLQVDLETKPGAGAAGGLGGGAVAFLNATILPGSATVMEITKITSRIEDFDLVITGEGQLDEQTKHGKVVWGVIESANAAGVDVIVICGQNTIDDDQDLHARTLAVKDIKSYAKDVDDSINNARQYLKQIAGDLPLFR